MTIIDELKDRKARLLQKKTQLQNFNFTVIDNEIAEIDNIVAKVK